jgi:hypothetical protein
MVYRKGSRVEIPDSLKASLPKSATIIEDVESVPEAPVVEPVSLKHFDMEYAAAEEEVKVRRRVAKKEAD